MQNDPEKILGNYNEFQGQRPPAGVIRGAVELQEGGQLTYEQQGIIETGISLVNRKVNEILGANNKLTGGDLELPQTSFVETDPEHPEWSGYFSSSKNKIAVITGKAKDRLSQTKVYIHEYLHFLSHNGRDDDEMVGDSTPIAVNNNIGFRRHFGQDIRRDKEGQTTGDYFLAFNEAVTEQLAQDILPGVHETYDDYRGLLNQVIDDVVVQRLGTEDRGVFQPWSREQVKDYIYTRFFMGDLEGFTDLLKTTYQKYDISEQQFGLMTHKDDLPSVIEKNQIDNRPDSPLPSPRQVAAMVQERLDNKTPDDYVTDIIGPESGDDDQIKYGTEYDTFVRENNIAYAGRENIGGQQYDIDNQGYFIYRGEMASVVFEEIKADLDNLLAEGVDAEAIAERMQKLLFETYGTSMLSDGFRDFYIYKHSKIDAIT